MTLKDVAQASGLSIGFMSQIERNLTVPSLSSLATVAAVLKTSIAELAVQPSDPHPDTYGSKRVPYQLPDGRVRYERLSTVFPGSVLHSVKFMMPVGYRSETVSHAGEEMVFVLSGDIVYRVAQQRYELTAGDSLHFDAATPHSIEATGGPNGLAEVIWSGTLDIFGDHEVARSNGHASELRGTEFNERISS